MGVSMTEVAFQWSRFILRLGGCLLLWWVLTGGTTLTSWIIGIPTIALALWAMPSVSQSEHRPLSLPGLLQFVPYFLLQSVRGGIDVARRAYSPALPLDPDIIDFPLSLPPGRPQIFFLNSVSLLPGTLSAELSGTLLKVHVLDRHMDSHLHQLQTRVARVFNCPLGGNQ